jgi:phage anti-repressor protein/phage antirepressor YoqD-like protein
MTQLITINKSIIGDSEVNTVNARNLHLFLGVKSEFRNWIKNRINDFGFTQDVDFVAGKFLPGSEQVDYFLSIDMAKELSMVERNEKGKQARLYFIECEKVAKEQPAIDPMKVLNDPAAMRGLLLTYSEKVLSLESTISEQAPKVAALDRISTADGTFCITDAAKTLQMRPKDLFTWLSGNKWTYRRVGGSGWLAYQERIQQGFLEHKTTTVGRSDGSEKITEQVRVTAKGLSKLAESFSVARA